MKAWLGAEARKSIADVVRAIEAKTSAEIVVTVRAQSATYRHVDLAVGAACAFVALLIYVYAPIEFMDDPAPPVIAVFFAAGALVSGAIPAVQRRLSSASARRENVRVAARAAFVDQGIGRTRARNGVLVYLSLLEREVEIVTDVGIDLGDQAEAWGKALAALEQVVRGGGDVASVGARLRALGETLAVTMPVQADDANELPDAPVVGDGVTTSAQPT